MTTRPIPLPDWAARALDEERLTQWRWRLKVQPPAYANLEKVQDGVAAFFLHEDAYSCDRVYRLLDLPMAPGDVLWVQETWAPTLFGEWAYIQYRHDSGGDEYLGHAKPITMDQFDSVDKPRRGWRSPVTMPRWASRWTLTVESVRVERVRDAVDGPNGDYWFERFGPGAWERDWCAVAVVKAERRNVDADGHFILPVPGGRD